MKNRILLLLFVLITNLTQAATIYVNVHNVNGNLVSGTYVKLYNSSWNLIKTGYTNSSGTATFALLDYGTYHYEVYYTGEVQEFWGSQENISLQSPTLTSDFTRYWPCRYSYDTPSSSVYTGNQVTFDITVKNKVSFSRNVKVEIWVDRNKTSSWDFNQTSSAQSISSNGTKTFSFDYTPTAEGTYYWKMNVLTYNNGSGSYIVTDSYSWTTSFTATDQVSDLDIYVKNVNGNYVEDAYVKLFDDSWNFEDDDYTNSSGRADFNNLDYGTYHYEVYYTGDVLEYWGGDENININSASESETFTRDWPYRFGYTEPSSNVDLNSPVTYEITIKNELSFSRNVKVKLWVDRDQTSSWDFYELSNYQSISGNGTKTFTFNYTPTTSGTYYWKMHVLSYNDGAGDYIVTDSYSWANSFEALNNEPFPITEGILIYHNYTNYSTAWDANLFMYDFSSDTKTDLSSGWNIDHEMNAHISPDGSMITFMGDDGGLPRDWDIYIWNIGSDEAPKNLTSPNTLNNLRDEDPKFSSDGTKIIFKQNGDIKIMNLDGSNVVSLSTDGMVIEESMPYMTTDGQKVVYSVGVEENADIYIMDSDGSNKTTLINEPNVFEYFPVIKDESSFFYTRWLNSSDHNDQIYLSDFSGNSSSLSINDLTSNNSDAYPVGSDYLFFSSTRTGSIGGYDLYVGQISTGAIWSLNDFGINSSVEDLGACYIAHQTFNISASANPSNGGIINGTGGYDYGQTCTLTASTETGYDFVNWTENGTQVSTDANYSFNVTSNRTLIANFEIQLFNIAASVNPNNVGSISGTGNYNYGETCNLTATTETGYDFVNWTENGTQVSTNANYSFTVTENRNLVANFEIQTFDISANVNPSNSGTVTGTGSYDYGQTCSLVANAESGYNFVNWTENGAQVSTDANYSLTVTSTKTLVANFSNQDYFITTNVNPSNSGTITGAGGYDYGQTCTLIATAETGYDFVNWTENGAQISTDSNYSFTVTSNRTLIANFEIQSFNIAASVNLNNGGSISGTGNYNYGETCNLTATAETGYNFVNWTENGTQVSTDANYSFTVSSNRTLIANFEIQSFNIAASVNPNNGGSIGGTGNYNYGETCNLTATTETGYDFINWTENGTQVSTDANYNFTVTSNRTLIANFEIQSFSISVSVNPNNGGSVSGADNYDYGQTCNLIATSETGYDFVNWTENGTQVSLDANYSFTVVENRVLVANFDNTNDVVELNDDLNINIYPNPTTGIVYIKGAKIDFIRIINYSGQVIKEVDINNDEIKLDLSNEIKGIYIIELISNNNIMTRKLLLE